MRLRQSSPAFGLIALGVSGLIAAGVIAISVADAFIGPSGSGGVGSGAIATDASNNVAIGSSTVASANRLNVYGSGTTSAAYAVHAYNSAGSSLFWVRNDGTTNVQGTLTVNGTALGSTMSAPNVSSGQFGANTGGGNYTFPSSVGIGTAPSYNLDINRTSLGGSRIYADVSSVNPGLTLYAPAGGYYPTISFVGNGSPVGTIFGYGGTGLWFDTNASLPFVFRPNSTEQFRITTTGILGTNFGYDTANMRSYFGVGSAQSAANFFGNAWTATQPVMVVRGAASQSANIIDTQNSAGTRLLSITSAGYIMFPDGTTQSTAAVSGSSTMAAANISAGSFGANTGGGNYAFPAHVVVGTTSPENSEGWSRVLDILGASHAKLSVRTAAIDARVLAHEIGWWGAPAGMILGTYSNHPLSFGTNANVRMTILANGNTGIGTTSPGSLLQLGSNTYQNDAAMRIASGNGSNTKTYSILTPYGGAAVTGRYYDFIIRDETAGVDLLNIDWSTSNVGIGTSDPQYKLQVVGTIHSSSGGFRFPDGTTQTTAAAGTMSAANVSSGQFGANTGGGIYTFPGSVRFNGDASGNYYFNVSATGGAGFTTLNAVSNQPLGRLVIGNSNNPSNTVIGAGGGWDTYFLGQQVGIGCYGGTYRFCVGPAGDGGVGGTGTNFGVMADGTVGMTNGSAAAPSLAAIGDTNTGLYWSGGDTISLSTGGTQRLTVRSDGSVGIGIATPSGRLDIGSGALYFANNAADSCGMFAQYIAGAQQVTFGSTGCGTNEYWQFTSAGGGNLMKIQANGNVGIATTTPGYKLTVAGTIYSSSGGFRFPDGTTQTTAASGSGTIAAANVSSGSFGANTGGGNYTFPGTVTLSTTASGNLLSVGTTGSSQARIAASTGSGIAGINFTSNSNTWFVDNRGSNDVSLPANRLGIFNTGGNEIASITQSGNLVLGISGASAFPNFGSTDRLIMNTSSSLAWHSNGSISNRIYDNGYNGLTIEGEGSWWSAIQFRNGYLGTTTNQIALASGGGGGVYTFFASGNVGIGTKTPGYLLDVASAGGTTARIGTSSGDTLTIGDGAGKINVGTIDPIYQIGNEKFATYMAGMIGVKEEVAGDLEISCVDGRCVKLIDFAKEDHGSDLWLFGKVTDIRKHLPKASILLTPGFDGRVRYEKGDGTLTIIATPFEKRDSVEVSYRFTAPRFDADSWSNRTTDKATGFIIP